MVIFSTLPVCCLASYLGRNVITVATEAVYPALLSYCLC